MAFEGKRKPPTKFELEVLKTRAPVNPTPTPGPWKAVREHDTWVIYGRSRVTDDEVTVATVEQSHEGFSVPVDALDAKLIAAAT